MSAMDELLRRFSYGRQRLDHAARDAGHALRDVIGVYSAHPTAPLSLDARSEHMSADDFRGLDALRLPAMRGSIHLLPRARAHLAFHARGETPSVRAARLRDFGIEEAEFDRLRAAVLAAVADGPLTARELRAAVASEQTLAPVLGELNREGSLMRLGAHGMRSNELFYARADITPADAGEALSWLAGEYLRAFGPARPKDFIWWSGARAPDARAALDSLDTEEIGDGLLLRREDLSEWESAPPVAGKVDLLPKWDCYTMGYPSGSRGRFADEGIAEQLYDFRGDGLPVVLVDARAVGTWGVRASRTSLEFELDLFEQPGAKARAAIDSKLERVRALLA